MNTFLTELSQFIDRVEMMPRFKGKAQAVKALRRIMTLAAFK